MTLPDHDHDGGLPARQIWIASWIGAVVLVLGVVVALTSGGQGGASARRTRTPAASPSVSAPAPAVASPVASSPAASPSSSNGASSTPAAAVVRWHGVLTMRDGPRDNRDLDAVPPATAEQERADSDFKADWLETILHAEADGVRLAVASGSPGRDRCRELLATGGSTSTDTLRAGDVVCVVTSQGRTGRLRVLEARQTSTSPYLRFDVTVWDPTG